MTRTTQHEVQAAFAWLTRSLWARNVDTSGWLLVKHPGGWRVEERNDDTSHSLPYGYTVRPARDMVDVLRFAAMSLVYVAPLRALAVGSDGGVVTFTRSGDVALPPYDDSDVDA